MSNLKTDKVLYFTAGQVPTAAEIAAIARLMVTYANVFVRNGGAAAADVVFGSGAIEACDLCAGTIPTSYNAKTVITVPVASLPDSFAVVPATFSINHVGLETETMHAVKVEIDPTTGLAKLTDLTTDASVAWTTSDASKATVGAATGKVTAVAAGSCNIIATLTVNGVTKAAQCALTVT